MSPVRSPNSVQPPVLREIDKVKISVCRVLWGNTEAGERCDFALLFLSMPLGRLPCLSVDGYGHGLTARLAPSRVRIHGSRRGSKERKDHRDRRR